MSGGILTFPTPSAHVLVADDARGDRRLFRHLLRTQGHRISEAEDGEQAVELIAEGPPDVVVLDVLMPKLDGYEVCRRIKQNPETAPIHVLMITGMTEAEARLKGIEAGANDFLSKPIDTKEVLLRVRNAVQAKRLYDQIRREYHQLAAFRECWSGLRNIVKSDGELPLTLISLGLEMLKWDNRETQRGAPSSTEKRISGMVEKLDALLDGFGPKSGHAV